MVSLGIDIGTTSISMVLVDVKKRAVIHAKTIPNDSFLKNKKGWEKQQDPNRIVTNVLQTIEEMDIENKEISYIGLTGQMHGILYVDANGDAISPLYTWQDGVGDQPYKDGETYAEHLQRITGVHMAAGFGGTTYFAHQMQGQVPEEAVVFCTIGDYLGMKLSGRKEPLLDITNAASLGLYDLQMHRFMDKEIKKAKMDMTMFPKVSLKRQILGYWKQKIPVGMALGDNQASYMGAVEKREETVLVNIGTGSQISFLLDHYEELDGMELRPFTENQYLAVASGLCGGRAYALLANFYEEILRSFCAEVEKNDIYAWMEEQIKDYQEKEPQLTVNPVFNGTRTEPHLRGEITKIDTENLKPQDLTYGMLKGISTELYHAYEKCSPDIKKNIRYLVGSGNGIRQNKTFQRMISKQYSLPIILSENEEEAASGAALEIMM